MRSDTNVMKDIYSYRTYLSARDSKYNRNWNRYVNNGARRSTVWELYGNPLAYNYSTSDEDTGVLPIINVIRSCIETHVSKISQTKVRPFLNPINGSYETFKVTENAQVFFDEYFQEENIYKKATEALRDAEIFEYGVLWIDEQDVKIKKVSPWQYFYDPAEYNYGKQLTRIFVEFRDYPLSILKESKTGPSIPQTLLDQWENFPDLKVKYNVYYDLANKERIEIINDQIVKRIPLQSKTNPFKQIWYSDPVKGGFSTSLVDNLYTIQTQIDTLAHRIHQASELNPANSIFIPSGALGQAGTIKKSMISNKIGNIYEYDASVPGNGSPVVSTPRFIDPQYMQMLDNFILKAYEMEGISQLSAMSKKPSGLNSGVALDTYQDVESERHNVILQNYIRFLMGIAIDMIEIFPEDALVIPPRRGVKAIKWKDVKKARKEFSLQFSPSSVLSNDPSTKMEEVEKLIQMKVINGPQASKLLEFPDTNGAFNVVNSSYDDCQAIIQRAIENDEYDYYEVVNVQELYGEIVTMILRLDSNNEGEKVMGRLTKLLNVTKKKIDTLNQISNPPQGPPPPNPKDQAPVQDLSMNGAQVTAIAEIVEMVQAKRISPDSARALITAAFPNTSPDLIMQMTTLPQDLPTAPIIPPAPQNEINPQPLAEGLVNQ